VGELLYYVVFNMSESTLRTKPDVESIVVLPESKNEESFKEFKNAKRLEDIPLEIRKRQASERIYLTRYE